MRVSIKQWECGDLVIERRSPEPEVRGSNPTLSLSKTLYSPKVLVIYRKCWLGPAMTEKIVDWDVKPQHKHNKQLTYGRACCPLVDDITTRAQTPITKTCPCNIMQFFKAVKMTIFG